MTHPAAADSMVLFVFPDACSRVTMSAFEEAGLDYEERMVNIFADQQKSLDYLSLNPKAKVPALLNGGSRADWPQVGPGQRAWPRGDARQQDREQPACRSP